MSEPRKQKKQVTSFKKIKKSENEITQIDSKTYYVKSTNPEQEPYMVFQSDSKGWLCDCMAFVMNMTDAGNKDCKHISLIKKTYNI